MSNNQQNRNIEAGLQSLKTTLDLLDSNIDRKKKRKAELRTLVAEDTRLNKEIGILKKQRREAKAHLDFLIDFFKQINGGSFPDGIYPLFAQGNTTPQRAAS